MSKYTDLVDDVRNMCQWLHECCEDYDTDQLEYLVAVLLEAQLTLNSVSTIDDNKYMN